ncbi:hypothetical protein [Amycolatopsis sp. Hca4]|uniref:hypothetical protein n=1 Tax=Amycolatopsis sp. Hca4 TaxID=2742131 RepID=UPI0015906CAB|nr:hypothetical protein [Amycolatopsis sp. Hca4]QKV80459.1 hypothetical protein HUT10_46780 [Amycolatopsis sp. Hca4]
MPARISSTSPRVARRQPDAARAAARATAVAGLTGTGAAVVRRRDSPGRGTDIAPVQERRLPSAGLRWAAVATRGLPDQAGLLRARTTAGGGSTSSP